MLALQPEIQKPLDQILIGQPRLGRRRRHLFVVGQLRIRVGFEEVACFYIDYDDTGQVIAQITKIDDILNVVWFLFLESAIQQPNG